MTFNFIGMVTIFVRKFSWIINSLVFITMRLKFGVCFPAIRDNNCSRLNSFLDDRQWCLFVPFFHCHQKTFPAVFLNSSKDPLTFNMMTTVVFLFRQSVRLFHFCQVSHCYLVEWFRKLRDRNCRSPPQCFQLVLVHVLFAPDQDLGTTNMSSSKFLPRWSCYYQTSFLSWSIPLPCVFYHYLPFCIPTSNHLIDPRTWSNSFLQHTSDKNVLLPSALHPLTSVPIFLCPAFTLPGCHITTYCVCGCDHSSL